MAENRFSTEIHFVILSSPDEDSPTLMIERPADGAAVDTLTPEVLLRYGDEGSGIDPSSVVVSVDGNALKTCDSGSDVARCDSPVLAAGDHQVIASVADRSGNQVTASSDFVIPEEQADTTPPVIEILLPDESTVYEDPLFEIQARYSDSSSGVDAASFVVEVNGADVTGDCLVRQAGASCLRQLEPGSYQVAVTVADLSGNEASASLSFEVLSLSQDQVAPQIEFFDPLAGETLTSSVYVAEITYFDGESGFEPGVDSFALELGGSDALVACGVVRPVGATCQIEGLTDGAHTLTARVTDRAGNEASTVVSFTVALDPDTVPPSIVVLEPPPVMVGEVPESARILFEDEESGVDFETLSVELDGQDLEPRCRLMSFLGCSLPTLAEGAHSLGVQVADMAGNVGSSQYSFEIFAIEDDVSAPLIRFVEPSQAVVEGDPTPRLGVDFGDPGPVSSGVDRESFQLLLDGEDVTPLCEVGTGGARCEAPSLADGPHTLSAEIRDLAGNVGQATLSFEIIVDPPDTIDPEIAIVSPADKVVVGDVTPRIAIVASDDSGLDLTSLGVLLAGQEIVERCVVEADGTFCEPPRLETGPHRLEVEISDLARAWPPARLLWPKWLGTSL